MAKTTNLSVHRNNLRQKQRKALRNEMRTATSELCKQIPNITGYAFVAWDENNARAYWCSGNMDAGLVGEFAKRTINRTQNIMDADEHFDAE